MKTKLFVFAFSILTLTASYPDHPAATDLNNQGSRSFAAGRYRLAEQQFARALQMLPANPDPSVRSIIWVNLGAVYRAEARYADSETFYRKALADREARLGSDSPELVNILNGMTLLYTNSGRLSEAETAGRRALRIAGDSEQLDLTTKAEARNNLASALYARGRYQEAEQLLPTALAISQHNPTGALQLDATLSLLGRISLARGRYEEADRYLSRAVDVATAAGDRAGQAASWSNLAQVREGRGDLQNAQTLLEQSLAVFEQIHGREHPDVATVVSKLGSLFRKKHDLKKAARYYEEALEIDRKTTGSESAKVAGDLGNLGALAVARKQLPGAESYFDQALRINTSALGPDHPDTGLTEGNLAVVFCLEHRFPEAEPLFKRAAAIREQTYGPDDPSLGKLLEDYAAVLKADKNFAEAEQVEVRATRIQVKNALRE